MCMLVKVIGSILILTGSCGCGWYQVYREKRRIRMLQDLQQLLLLLYGDIEYAAGDLAANMDSLSGKSRYFAGFFQGVAARLEQRDGQTLYRIWQTEMESSLGQDVLGREDMELIDEIGRQLGGLDRDTQLQLLQVQSRRVEQQLQDAREQYRGKSRIYRVVGITVGVFTCVLLL